MSSSPNTTMARANHSHLGSHGGHHHGGPGSSVGTNHSPCLLQCSTRTAHHSTFVHVALGATTEQGRGRGPLSTGMAYSPLALSLTFSSFIAMSHDTMGHSMSSLSQLQSTTAAKRRNTTTKNKNNAAKKMRYKSDSNNTEYNDKEDILPCTDVALGEEQREHRRLGTFITDAVVKAHCLEFIQRAFPSK
jgi:hypothetical protein